MITSALTNRDLSRRVCSVLNGTNVPHRSLANIRHFVNQELKAEEWASESDILQSLQDLMRAGLVFSHGTGRYGLTRLQRENRKVPDCP